MRSAPSEAEFAAAAAGRFAREMLLNPGLLRGPLLRGSVVAEFEQALAAHCGYEYCLATCNATMALLLTALSLEVQGKDIIAAPHGWAGSFGPFMHAGATLVHAGEDDQGNLSPSSAASMIHAPTAAILATDWQGRAHDARGVRRLCDENGLAYVLDTGRLRGWNMPMKDAYLADILVLSFGPGKTMCLGEGGALLTSDRGIYSRCLSLSQHPERCAAEEITACEDPPFLNSRMHPLAAVLGTILLGSGHTRRLQDDARP